MVVFPWAKINLGLYITEKRSDGFHNIESLFYPIPFCDVLEILPSEQASFQSSGLPIPGSQEQNLCWKAYECLKKDHKLGPVQLHLHKIIPMGAGLGGGSSDAAQVLMGLNACFQLGLGPEDLWAYAHALGSDCGFFLQEHAAIGRGRGDELQAYELDLSSYYLVLLHPQVHISTAAAYARVRPKTPDFALEGLNQVPIKEWKHCLQNDFEAALFPSHPILAEIKQGLYAQGAIYAAMSGSGSALFGLFHSAPSLGPELEKWKVWSGYLTSGNKK